MGFVLMAVAWTEKSDLFVLCPLPAVLDLDFENEVHSLNKNKIKSPNKKKKLVNKLTEILLDDTD